MGDGAYRTIAEAYRYASRRPLPRVRRSKLYDVVFYCEQPSHWQNIELVVGRLLSEMPWLKVRLVTTYDSDDYRGVNYPAELKVDFGIPKSELSHLNTRILFTPYVGLARVLRPKEAIVVHALVSLTGLDGVYSPEMFDNYDFIVCAGPHHIRDFQRWADSNSHLRGKVLVAAGYPKLDLTIRRVGEMPTPDSDAFTVVYAPTHVYAVNEKLASLRAHGDLIVDALLAAGFEVIFRPHPESFNDADKCIIQRILERHKLNEKFRIDRSKNYMETYAKADLMVTDLSGTGFTFSLSFLRPTIFFAADEIAEQGLRGIQFEDRGRIGGLARSVPELIDAIGRIRVSGTPEDILRYREQTVFNVGSSADSVASTLSALFDGKWGSEWIKL